MADSDDNRTITGWKTASKWYRQPPGWGWLSGLIAVPLLLGLMGWSGLQRSDRDVEVALPSVDPTATLTAPTRARQTSTRRTSTRRLCPSRHCRSRATETASR